MYKPIAVFSIITGRWPPVCVLERRLYTERARYYRRAVDIPGGVDYSPESYCQRESPILLVNRYHSNPWTNENCNCSASQTFTTKCDFYSTFVL